MKILVYQSSEAGQEFVRMVMKVLKLTEDIDFAVIGEADEVQPKVLPGERQMLISGTFGGSTLGLSEWIMSLKDINQELFCVAYASAEESHLEAFDWMIQKSCGAPLTELMLAVERFLGSLDLVTA